MLIGRVLVEAVAEHARTSPSDALQTLVAGQDLTGVAEAATFHRVAGCVRNSLRPLSGWVDGRILDSLELAYHADLQAHLRILSSVARIHGVLQPLGLPWLVLKGPVLNEVVYRRPDLRRYGDLDILVPPEALPEAIGAFESAGDGVLTRNWRLVRERMPGEVYLLLRETGVLVDLHWHPLCEAVLRKSFPIRVHDLFERSRAVRLGALPVRTLDPVDTLCHLALHACISGGNRLVWMKDIEQSILNESPDWQAVAERALEWRAGLPVAAMLHRAARALSVEVPCRLLSTLAPGRSWMQVVKTVDRLPRLERATGRRSPAGMVARAARSDVPSSAMELARRSMAWLGQGMRILPPLPVPVEPSSMELGNAAMEDDDRRGFLQAVAAHL